MKVSVNVRDKCRMQIIVFLYSIIRARQPTFLCSKMSNTIPLQINSINVNLIWLNSKKYVRLNPKSSTYPNEMRFNGNSVAAPEAIFNFLADHFESVYDIDEHHTSQTDYFCIFKIISDLSVSMLAACTYMREEYRWINSHQYMPHQFNGKCYIVKLS